MAAHVPTVLSRQEAQGESLMPKQHLVCTDTVLLRGRSSQVSVQVLKKFSVLTKMLRWRRADVLAHIKELCRAPDVYCMITSGSMLKSRSSLSLRTSSRRAVSSCSAPCRSAVAIRGRPFSFTIMSPSLIPPLETEKNQDKAFIDEDYRLGND